MRIIHKETSTHKRLIKRIHDIKEEVMRYTKKYTLLKCIYSPWLYFILWYINELHQRKTKISKPSQLTLRELMLVGYFEKGNKYQKEGFNAISTILHMRVP